MENAIAPLRISQENLAFSHVNFRKIMSTSSKIVGSERLHFLHYKLTNAQSS